MLSIKPTNPRIIWIARKFSEQYPDILLAKMLEKAHSGNEKAIVFLTTKPILRNNAEKFVLVDDPATSHDYKKYLCAIAQAQIHLEWENSEYEQLKNTLTMNFAPSRHVVIFSTIRDIAGELSETVSPRAETNFLNYLIDNLLDISVAKTYDVKFVVGDIDSELTSNKNGFILTGIQAEEITNLFVEAVNTPLQVSDK